MGVPTATVFVCASLVLALPPYARAHTAAAARSGETAQYELAGSIPAATGERGFDETFELLGVTFHVTSPNVTGENVVRVAPAGLELDNRPIEWRAEGVVTGAEVADLNVDGSPEVYVYVRGPGEEARGSLVAWAANRRKSLSMISLPALAAEASVGYRGHDEFAVVESVLGRRFPIFDASGERTGRMRQLQYELVPGEAGWQLRVERTVEF